MASNGYTLVQVRYAWRRRTYPTLSLCAAPADAYVRRNGALEPDVEGLLAPAMAELAALAEACNAQGETEIKVSAEWFLASQASARRRPCATCDASFIGTGHFCCNACAETAVRQSRQLWLSRRRAARQFACAQCGEAFVPQRATARFCSTRCRVAAHRAASRV